VSVSRCRPLLAGVGVGVGVAKIGATPTPEGKKYFLGIFIIVPQ